MALALVAGAGWGSFPESRGMDLFPGVATAFGGGFGGTHQLICGALSGAMVALGTQHGQGRLDRERTYSLAAELVHDFEQAFGTAVCSELVGVDPSSTRWREAYQGRDAHTAVCWPCVEFAARRCWELMSLETRGGDSGSRSADKAEGG